MELEPITEDMRRFILASIPSVPYLEAMLLLRAEPELLWERGGVASRLYISEKAADELLHELSASGIIAVQVQDQDRLVYRYQPRTEDLRQRIDRLAEVYGKNLVEVASLIHSKLDRKAQHFADAFKWRKD